MEQDQELQGYSRLNRIARKEPFVEPEGYFSGFNNRLRDKLATEKKAPIRVWRPAILIVTAAMFAAGILLISRTVEETHQSSSTEFTEAMETAFLYGMEEEQVAEVYSSMFHESQEEDPDAYLLQQMDETTIISNL